MFRSSIFGDDSDDFVNLRVLSILATLIFVGVKRHLRREMISRSLVSGRNSSTFGDASDDFVNLRVLLDSSYAHFRRRKTCYRTINAVHFRGQTNFHITLFQVLTRPFSGMTPKTLSTSASCWILATPIVVGVKRLP